VKIGANVGPINLRNQSRHIRKITDPKNSSNFL